MTPERWQQVNAVFAAALRHEPAERPEFLRQACARDPSLRAEVDRLFAGDEQAGREGFLEAPCPLNVKAHLSADEPALVGRRIGPYEVKRWLASGGMGSVYLAVRVDDYRQEVAIKLIHCGLDTHEMLRRFHHERQVLARLNHPHIARLLDGGTTQEGQPYFVMEYIEGEPIDRYCATRGLAPAERLRLLGSVCDAVHYAHQRMVIHRDLKPSNILVDAAGQPKVLDFGVARVTDADVQRGTFQTGVGQLVGTLPYMSPEQAAGDPAEVDTRSDVYALGVIGYELLAGRPPYELKGKALPEAARVIAEEEPAPLGSVHKAFRGDLEAIVTKALEKDKARRYQSASELAKDIEHHLHDEPLVAARPPRALYRLRKFARRHKALVGGVAAVLLTLVAGTITTAWWAAAAVEQRDRAQRAEYEAQRRLIDLALQQARWSIIPKACDDALEAGHPDVIFLRLAKVKAWFALGDWDSARNELQLLSRRADLGEHEGSVLLLRGEMALDGDKDQAETLIDQALAKGLPDADRAYAQGLVAATSLDGVEHFRQAIASDPLHYRARSQFVFLLTLLGRLEEARREARAAEDVFPEHPNFKYIQAVLDALAGDIPSAHRRIDELKERGQLRSKQVADAHTAVDRWHQLARHVELLGNPDTWVQPRPRAEPAAFRGLGPPEGARDRNEHLAPLAGPLPLPPVIARVLRGLSQLAKSWAEIDRHPTDRDKAKRAKARALDDLGELLTIHPEGSLHFLRGLLLLRTSPLEAEKAFRAAAGTPAIARIRRGALYQAIMVEASLLAQGQPNPDPEVRNRCARNLEELLTPALGPVPPGFDAEYLVRAAILTREWDVGRYLLAGWERHAPHDLKVLRLRAQVELQAGAYGPALEAAKKVLAQETRDPEASVILQRVTDKLREQSQSLTPRE